MAWLRQIGVAAGLGLLSGLVCVGAREGLIALQRVLTGHGGQLAMAAAALAPWRRVLTPAVGGALAFAVLVLARRWKRSAEKSIDYAYAMRSGEGRIPFWPATMRFVSSAFAIATGMTIGREGSMIQFAASLCGAVPSKPLSNEERVRRLGYAVAAAVASVYSAPVAGVFFAAEIGMGQVAIAELVPFAVASAVGWGVTRLMLGPGTIFAIAAQVWTVRLADALPLLLLAGAAGLVAPVYSWLLHRSRVVRRVPGAIVLAGLLVGVLSLRMTAVWGNGETGMLDVVHGLEPLRWIALLVLLRLVASAACVGAGAIGGVFTPTVFLGGAGGLLAAAAVAHWLPETQSAVYIVLGVGCLLAAVTHAPWMAAFMALELTGPLHRHPAMLLLLVPACWLAAAISERLQPVGLYAAASEVPVDTPHEG